MAALIASPAEIDCDLSSAARDAILSGALSALGDDYESFEGAWVWSFADISNPDGGYGAVVLDDNDARFPVGRSTTGGSGGTSGGTGGAKGDDAATAGSSSSSVPFFDADAFCACLSGSGATAAGGAAGPAVCAHLEEATQSSGAHEDACRDACVCSGRTPPPRRLGRVRRLPAG